MAGDVSARAESRRDHLSRPGPGGVEGPAGVCRRIYLVGKQTKNSKRNTLAAISFLASSSPRFVLYILADSLPWLPLKAEDLSGLRSAVQTRSCAERWLGRSRNSAGRRRPHKLFAFHDLPIVVRRRGLTGESPKRYIPVRRGTSRCGGLSKSPNGPVAGLSPGNCGERGLTECEARSTASNLCVKVWSVSRPQSGFRSFEPGCKTL
jgi:hypothetical protein